MLSTQIEKMHTVKKVKVVILEPYKELLLWLCIADKSIRPQEFGNVILEICTSVNKAVEELNPWYAHFVKTFYIHFFCVTPPPFPTRVYINNEIYICHLYFTFDILLCILLLNIIKVLNILVHLALSFPFKFTALLMVPFYPIFLDNFFFLSISYSCLVFLSPVTSILGSFKSITNSNISFSPFFSLIFAFSSWTSVSSRASDSPLVPLQLSPPLCLWDVWQPHTSPTSLGRRPGTRWRGKWPSRPPGK